jgi:hypothetical protein
MAMVRIFIIFILHHALWAMEGSGEKHNVDIHRKYKGRFPNQAAARPLMIVMLMYSVSVIGICIRLTNNPLLQKLYSITTCLSAQLT